MGGKQLHKGDDYIISLVQSHEVLDVAEALEKITKEKLKEKYYRLAPEDYDGEIGEEDFEYTWDWFTDLPCLFKNAAADGRAVLFTVDQ